MGADGRCWCPHCGKRPKVTGKGRLARHRAKSGQIFSLCAGVGMRESEARQKYAKGAPGN